MQDISLLRSIAQYHPSHRLFSARVECLHLQAQYCGVKNGLRNRFAKRWGQKPKRSKVTSVYYAMFFQKFNSGTCRHTIPSVPTATPKYKRYSAKRRTDVTDCVCVCVCVVIWWWRCCRHLHWITNLSAIRSVCRVYLSLRANTSRCLDRWTRLEENELASQTTLLSWSFK